MAALCPIQKLSFPLKQTLPSLLKKFSQANLYGEAKISQIFTSDYRRLDFPLPPAFCYSFPRFSWGSHLLHHLQRNSVWYFWYFPPYPGRSIRSLAWRPDCILALCLFPTHPARISWSNLQLPPGKPQSRKPTLCPRRIFRFLPPWLIGSRKGTVCQWRKLANPQFLK